MLQSLPTFLSKAALPSAASLADLAPLEIQSSQSQGLKNFKEKWSPANCLQAIQHSGLYEAGRSLYWLDPGLSSNDTLLLEEPPYAEVLEAEQILCCSHGAGDRFFFPGAFGCFAPKHVLNTGELPTKLSLLHKHTQLYAWYVAMCRAWLDTDLEQIKKLHEMALTVTVRALATTDSISVTLEILTVNDKSRQGSNSDTFLMFAKKVQCIERQQAATTKKDLLQSLISKNVRFNGTKINKTVLDGALKVAGMLSDASSEILSRIQREHGRDVFSNNYSKLARLCTRCQKQVATLENVGAGGGAETLLEFTLGAAYVAVARNQCSPDFFNVETIDPRGDEVGWACGTVAKIAVAHQMVQLAEAAWQQAPVGSLKDEARKTSDALKKLGTPLAFHYAVPKEVDAGCSNAAEDVLEERDPLCGVTDGLDASGVKAVEFMISWKPPRCPTHVPTS